MFWFSCLFPRPLAQAPPSTSFRERGGMAAEAVPALSLPAAELLLLCWGSFLCYATRAVLSAFHEPRYMGIALHNELLLSTAFHTAR